MANTVFKLRRSSVAGKQPNTSTLSIGELALNLTDRKLYSSDGTNIWETGANLTTLNVSTNSAVNNVIVSGGIYVNGSFGTSGQVLTSNSSGLYWSSSSGGGALPFYGQYTGNGSATSFAVSGGYTPNYISVYLNGVLLRNGTEVDITSGTNVVISPAPANGSLIDIVGVSSVFSTGVSTMVSQQFTANGSTNNFVITGGYIANQVLVFLNGVKQIPGTDVDLTSGSNVVFLSTPPNNYIVDVYGYKTSVSLSSDILTVGANITLSTNSISIGNSSVNTQIVAGNLFLNGSTLVVGNTSSNITINSTSISLGSIQLNTSSYSGTANNTSFVGSVSAANVVSNAQLQANVTTLQGQITSNASAAYANAVSYTDGKSYVNTSQLSANLGNYQTTAGLNANIASYIPTYTGVVNGSSHTVGTSFTANSTVVNAVSYYAGTTLIGNTTGPYGKSEGTLNVNSALTSNNSSYLGGTAAASYALTSSLSSYQTTAGLSANVATLTSNNATYAFGKTEGNLNVNSALTANNSTNLGGTAAASYQLNSTLNANIASYLPTYTGVVNASSFTIGSAAFIANTTGVYTNNNISLTVNNKRLTFTPIAGGANVYFNQQNDDNFVFYSTNTINQPRAVFNIYANSVTSNLSFNVPVQFGANVGQLVSNGSAGSAGQVLTSNGSSTYWSTPAAVAWQGVQTSNVSATSNRGYPINSGIGAITVTLPASPVAGDVITVLDYGGVASSNNITINPNGNKIHGNAINAIINTNRGSHTLVYIDSTQGWLNQASTTQAGINQAYTVSYLIVAGGGGGGCSGGGGGAGGYITGTTTVSFGSSYGVTVGGGGGGQSGNGNAKGGTGGVSSVFSTTASGGGGGGSYNTDGGNGASGGSGGGGGGPGSGASGTPGQGNAGGNGGQPSGFRVCGGGGGAGSGGGTFSGTTAGSGGNGTASSITGSSVTYGGGGGGHSEPGTQGSGGSGGGGSGGNPGGTGGANLGGGGGGAYAFNTAGSGGSGIVIISYASATQLGSGGTVTSYTSGSKYYVHTFTTGGTFTA